MHKRIRYCCTFLDTSVHDWLNVSGKVRWGFILVTAAVVEAFWNTYPGFVKWHLDKGRSWQLFPVGAACLLAAVAAD